MAGDTVPAYAKNVPWPDWLDTTIQWPLWRSPSRWHTKLGCPSSWWDKHTEASVEMASVTQRTLAQLCQDCGRLVRSAWKIASSTPPEEYQHALAFRTYLGGSRSPRAGIQELIRIQLAYTAATGVPVAGLRASQTLFVPVDDRMLSAAFRAVPQGVSYFDPVTDSAGAVVIGRWLAATCATANTLMADGTELARRDVLELAATLEAGHTTPV